MPFLKLGDRPSGDCHFYAHGFRSVPFLSVPCTCPSPIFPELGLMALLVCSQAPLFRASPEPAGIHLVGR